MWRKNGLSIRLQQEKSYQKDELFLLGFEEVLKTQASVIYIYINIYIYIYIYSHCSGYVELLKRILSFLS